MLDIKFFSESIERKERHRGKFKFGYDQAAERFRNF